MNIEWLEILKVVGLYTLISVLLSVFLGKLFFGGKNETDNDEGGQ